MWWWGLALITAGVAASSGHLIGENVCYIEERYNVTIEKHSLKNVTIREFVWCLGVPPRCSKYHTVLKDDIKNVVEERTKLVDQCCPGYAEDATSTICIPVCALCVNGECVRPEQCVCKTGYAGLSCNLTCPQDKWSRGCLQVCDCANGATCDADTGSCQCSHEWTGLKCEIKISLDIHKEYEVCQDCDELSTKHNPETITTSTEINVQEFELQTPIPTYPQLEWNIGNKLDPPETTVILTSSHVTTSPNMKVNSKGYENENAGQWPMDEMRTQPKLKGVRDVLSNINVMIGTAVCLLFVAITSVLVVRYVNRRRLTRKCDIQKDDNENKLVNRPISFRNSYNAPLPDPPTFQNPIFTLVSDEKRHSMNSFSPSQKLSGLYNNLDESSELQYDYPPSTGSYRATSVPDPDAEPLYDEIPACRRPVPVLYLQKSGVPTAQRPYCITGDRDSDIYSKTSLAD